jgi:hypothetical protein
MKKTLLVLIIFSYSFTSKLSAQKGIDSTLLKKLEHMSIIDQLAASKSKSSSTLSTSEWADSVYQAHQKFLENTLNKFGYPGYNLVGKRGSQLYWVMVQHSDFNPNFQLQVLDSMYKEVQNNNADPINYAYLLDRVKMNMGEKLVYGTQVTYHWFSGKARYRPTIDPENLNQRRAEIGLEPIDIYLDEMTEVNNKMGNSILGGITNVALLLIISLIIIIGVIAILIFKRK